MEQRKKTSEKWILIGAGECHLDEIKIDENACLVAVDGGIEYCNKFALIPDYYIGDFDSISRENHLIMEQIKKTTPDKVISFPSEKDDTDMMAAIRIGIANGAKEFIIYGGLGNRLEHTIANIQCLVFIKENGGFGYLRDKDTCVYVLQNETMQYEETKTGYFSVFAMGEKADGIYIKGMKYPLSNATITDSFPIGVSNEFTGKKAEVSVGKNKVLVIESSKQ